MTIAADMLSTREQEFFGAFSNLLKDFEDFDGKYSLWKVHNHFSVMKDEVLHETSDSNRRESITSVIKADQLPDSAFVSQWVVLADGTVEPEKWCCD
ncbi:MAG: hypothetical protein H0U73_05155 [Tatlockia sp.]|nr:hypothetical protein [Tatlockia sp.]